jgi:hypothetical protein
MNQYVLYFIIFLAPVLRISKDASATSAQKQGDVRLSEFVGENLGDDDDEFSSMTFRFLERIYTRDNESAFLSLKGDESGGGLWVQCWRDETAMLFFFGFGALLITPPFKIHSSGSGNSLFQCYSLQRCISEV